MVGAYNAFEAAAANGCRRIVFASSINAIRGYTGEGVRHCLSLVVLLPFVTKAAPFLAVQGEARATAGVDRSSSTLHQPPPVTHLTALR